MVALSGLFALLLLGGGHYVATQGIAFVFIGMMLLRRPPFHGLGRFFDIGVLIVLGASFQIFFTRGGGFFDYLIHINSNEFQILEGMELRWHLLSIAESFILSTGILIWLYAVNSWQINREGRDYVYFAISLFAFFVGLCAFLGTHFGWEYPLGAEGVGFTFFGAAGEMEWILLILGLFSMCYGFESLARPSALHLAGVAGGAACYLGIFLGGYGLQLILFLIGLGIYFFTRLRVGEIRQWQKGLLGFIFSASFILLLLKDIDFFDLIIPQHYTLNFAELFLTAPLSGIGLGNYSEVAEFFGNEGIVKFTEAIRPNDFLWMGVSLGIPGLIGFFFILIGYIKEVKVKEVLQPMTLRFLPFIPLFIFIVGGFYGTPRHSLLLFLLCGFLLAVALPLTQRRTSSKISPTAWKFVGYFFIFVGVVWAATGIFSLPLHTKIQTTNSIKKYEQATEDQNFVKANEYLERLISINPLEKAHYIKRAKLALKLSDLRGAEKDFIFAQVLDQRTGDPSYQAGLSWLETAPEKTEEAWTLALEKENQSPFVLFKKMLLSTDKNRKAYRIVRKLSRTDATNGVLFMESLDKYSFEDEIDYYMEVDPFLEAFDRNQKFLILNQWIQFGGSETVRLILKENQGAVANAWYLESLLYKNEARFEEATELMRKHLKPIQLPEISYSSNRLAIIKREFSNKPAEINYLLRMLQLCMYEKDYERGLQILEKYFLSEDASDDLYYLKGELSYLQGDPVSSWISFDNYAKAQLNLQK